MDYPLNMTHKEAGGYAVANDESEHELLSERGYEPKLEKTGTELDQVRAQLDAVGVEYDRRWGLARLKALLPS